MGQNSGGGVVWEFMSSESVLSVLHSDGSPIFSRLWDVRKQKLQFERTNWAKSAGRRMRWGGILIGSCSPGLEVEGFEDAVDFGAGESSWTPDVVMVAAGGNAWVDILLDSVEKGFEFSCCFSVCEDGGDFAFPAGRVETLVARGGEEALGEVCGWGGGGRQNVFDDVAYRGGLSGSFWWLM